MIVPSVVTNSIDICDAIKQNKLELANINLEIKPKKADQFLCFLLFLQSFEMLFLKNQLPNLHGILTKLKLKKDPNIKWQKTENKNF